MSHRFRFIGELNGKKWTLGPDETQHLAKILKLKVGDEVEVTDGVGRWASGTIEEIKGKEATILSREIQQDSEGQVFVTLALAALKPGNFDDILPSIIELGVDEIVIFQSAETAKFRSNPQTMERWQRIARQSIKQCKRAWLPEIQVLDSTAALVDWYKQSESIGIVLEASASVPLHNLIAATDKKRITLVIGSEKGLAPSEMQMLLAAGLQPAKLGSHILRAVTVVPAALGVVASIKK